MTIILLATTEVDGGEGRIQCCGEARVFLRTGQLPSFGSLAPLSSFSSSSSSSLSLWLSLSTVNSYYPYRQSLANKRSRELFAEAINLAPPPGSKPTPTRPSWYPLNNPLLPSNTPGPCWCPFENNPPRPPKRLIPLWIEKERRHFYGDHFHSHLVLKRLKNLLKPDVMMAKTRHFENLGLIEKTISGAWCIWKLSEGILVRKTQ